MECTRRKFLKKAVEGNAAIALLGYASSVSSNIADNNLVTSISWIDSEGIPNLRDLSILDQGLILIDYWPARVLAGLQGTANSKPPSPVITPDYESKKDFRAFMQYGLHSKVGILEKTINPGYTPPLDPKKVPELVALAELFSESKESPGEKSSISEVYYKELHPNSSLTLPAGYSVLSSALIKFRAGSHTDNIGKEKAKSPFHVPWVWSEHALINKGNELALLMRGSRFPSHAWYFNGNLVYTQIQSKLMLSTSEPALSTGADINLPQASKNETNVKGSIDLHKYTVRGMPSSVMRIVQRSD